MDAENQAWVLRNADPSFPRTSNHCRLVFHHLKDLSSQGFIVMKAQNVCHWKDRIINSYAKIVPPQPSLNYLTKFLKLRKLQAVWTTSIFLLFHFPTDRKFLSWVCHRVMVKLAWETCCFGLPESTESSCSPGILQDFCTRVAQQRHPVPRAGQLLGSQT